MNTRNLLAALAFTLTACASALGQPVTVFARIYVTPGREAEAQARLEKLVAYVLEHEPDITYRFFRDRSNPQSILTYEVYPTPQDAQRHLKEILPAAQAALGPSPEGLWAKPTEIQAATPFLGR
jgi:quinol monooxygenase YgiN